MQVAGYWFARARRPLSTQELAVLRSRAEHERAADESWSRCCARLIAEAVKAQPFDRVLVFSPLDELVASLPVDDPSALLARAHEQEVLLGCTAEGAWWGRVRESQGDSFGSWTGTSCHEVRLVPAAASARSALAALIEQCSAQEPAQRATAA